MCLTPVSQSVITPNQLLLGRSSDYSPPIDYREEDGKWSRRLAYVSNDSWWSLWIKQVLPTLVPIKRWRKVKKNLCKGDVVLIRYANPLKDEYRIGRVTETHPDKSGLVRSVTVAFRKRNIRESATEYKSKPLVEEIMAVQRLSLLVSASEQ